MRPTETKAQRFARKFGVRPKRAGTNGVNGRLHYTQPTLSNWREPTAVDRIQARLSRQFGVSCTVCFTSVLDEMSRLSVEQIAARSEDFARSIYENAKERDIQALLSWANYRKHGLHLFERLVLDACEEYLPAPAVNATFVWLYFDGDKQSDELRWSIRSVLANYHGIASVILFGDKPAWYSGPHVPIKRVRAQYRRRFRDTLNKMHAACNSSLVPNTFVWMMDDTYFIKRVSMRDLSVNRYQGHLPGRATAGSGFAGVKHDAYEALQEARLPCVDYCTHLPKVVEKAKFLEIWDRFNLAKQAISWELLYGGCFYDNYRPLDDFFGLILNGYDLRKMKRAKIINNGTNGWSERLRAGLWLRFPNKSEFETVDAGPPRLQPRRISRRYNYEIRAGYRCGTENNSGIAVPDAAQRNVYEFAAAIPSVESVMDWGTGSGAKLVELFAGRKCIGVDVEEKVSLARQRFPDHEWRTIPTEIDCDLLIVADVIEHLADPVALLNTIKAGRWRHCVISTPERDLARGVNDMGPPKNPRHVREWNTGEFVRFLRKQELGTLEEVRVLGEYNLVVHLARATARPHQP